MIINAENLNRHLDSGGVVQVTTRAKSTLYKPRHAGYFSTGNDGRTRSERI